MLKRNTGNTAVRLPCFLRVETATPCLEEDGPPQSPKESAPSTPFRQLSTTPAPGNLKPFFRPLQTRSKRAQTRTHANNNINNNKNNTVLNIFPRKMTQ